MGKVHKCKDEIIDWANGKDIEAFSEVNNMWIFIDNPSWSDHIQYRIKPEPVYPESSLTAKELEDLYSKSADYLQHTEALQLIANKAVARHCQDQEKEGK